MTAGSVQEWAEQARRGIGALRSAFLSGEGWSEQLASAAEDGLSAVSSLTQEAERLRKERTREEIAEATALRGFGARKRMMELEARVRQLEDGLRERIEWLQNEIRQREESPRRDTYADGYTSGLIRALQVVNDAAARALLAGEQEGAAAAGEDSTQEGRTDG